MLVHLLRSHPNIVCHGEVFALNALGHIHGKYAQMRRQDPKAETELLALAQKDPKSFLTEVVFDPQDHKAVGFKYKTDEAFNRKLSHIRDLIAADPDVKIIYLVRRNILDQYISHHVVLKKTGITLLKEQEDRPEIKPFAINIRKCIKYANDVMSRHHDITEHYNNHKNITVFYEDLVAKNETTFDNLQDFLGVERTNLSTPTKKIIESSKNLVTNYEEAEAKLTAAGLLKLTV